MDHHHNNSDSSDDSVASNHSIEHPPVFNCDGNRPEKKRSSHDATLINSGSPALYQLNTENKFVIATDSKVRRWTYGRRDRNKKNKVILMVGETGAGKTTFANTMINYLLEVKFEDKKFYQITEEMKEHQHQIKSQTSEITVYEVFVEENPTSLTIIDTPGYAHTEGHGKDGEIAEDLRRLFSAEDGIHHIDAVCFVIKASQNRFSGKELYIFHSVLSLFARDIEDNIMFIVTHSDGLPPTDTLSAINAAEIPCRRKNKTQPIHFLFNNRQKEERKKQCDHIYRSAWEMGEKSMNEFFKHLKEKNRKSLTMTLKVLNERRQLEACVSNLKEQISEVKKTTEELTQIQEAIRNNRDEILKYNTFEFTVEKVFKEKVSIENESWMNRNATCCSVCQENCHEWGCWWVNNPSNCSVMKNNHCTVCTGKCHHSKHTKENKKYVMKKKEMEMTFEKLKQEYECAGDQNVSSVNKTKYEGIKKKLESYKKDSENKTVKEQQLISHLEKIKNVKSDPLHQAYILIISLSNIALKADSAFTLQHLDFLILELKEERKDEWRKHLEDLKKSWRRAEKQGRFTLCARTEPKNE